MEQPHKAHCMVAAHGKVFVIGGDKTPDIEEYDETKHKFSFSCALEHEMIHGYVLTLQEHLMLVSTSGDRNGDSVLFDPERKTIQEDVINVHQVHSKNANITM